MTREQEQEAFGRFTFYSIAAAVLFVFVVAYVLFTSCAIPVVGNSPEERKHREQLKEEQDKGH